MLKTLRNRLILSHVLPLLIIIPVMGVALVIVLETRFLLPNQSRALTGDAVLLAEFAGNQAEIWEDDTLAQKLLSQSYPRLAKRVMLISPEGRLVASSDPADADRLNQILEIDNLSTITRGELVTKNNYSQRLKGEVIDVFAPVTLSNGEPAGVVRVTSRFETISDELLQLRYLIGSVMIIGLFFGTSLGSILAVNIISPMQQVTQAIISLAHGNRREKLPEYGPEEIRLLLSSVNFLVDRLRSLEQSRRHLLANIVHELGRPLGALRMAVQVLIQGAKQNPNQLDELLEGMDQELGRLQHLLEDLAHLHDQVLGHLELDLQAVSLAEWLPVVLRPWKAAAYEKNLEWEVSIQPELPGIEADPVRFSQLIGNLVSNAIKFTPAGGKVSVSAGTHGEMVTIAVCDNGAGIAPDETERIFAPFYRGKQISRVKQGMGLGLSIAQDVVNAHGGRIEVDSRPGEGSCFTVWIPLKIKEQSLDKTPSLD